MPGPTAFPGLSASGSRMACSGTMSFGKPAGDSACCGSAPFIWRNICWAWPWWSYGFGAGDCRRYGLRFFRSWSLFHLPIWRAGGFFALDDVGLAPLHEWQFDAMMAQPGQRQHQQKAQQGPGQCDKEMGYVHDALVNEPCRMKNKKHMKQIDRIGVFANSGQKQGNPAAGPGVAVAMRGAWLPAIVPGNEKGKENPLHAAHDDPQGIARRVAGRTHESAPGIEHPIENAKNQRRHPDPHVPRCRA